jgi:predicted transcriptional regulator
VKRFWKGRGAPIAIPDAELAVLKVLWENGDATIRAITDVLYPGGEASHYATVQKLLERLQGRRCVARRRTGRAHVYTATIARDDLIRDRLRDAAEKLCEGSFSPLLTQLVDAGSLSAEEVLTLRRLIERLDQEES